jgi:hypothetical protein
MGEPSLGTSSSENARKSDWICGRRFAADLNRDLSTVRRWEERRLLPRSPCSHSWIKRWTHLINRLPGKLAKTDFESATFPRRIDECVSLHP